MGRRRPSITPETLCRLKAWVASEPSLARLASLLGLVAGPLPLGVDRRLIGTAAASC